MRLRHLATAGTATLSLLCASSPTWAGSLKVVSVDQKGMVVVDRPSVRRAGDEVSAAVLTVSNRGFLPLAYYQTPRRSRIAVACGARTFSLDDGPVRAVASNPAAVRTADWLCEGLAPKYAIEAGDFSDVGAAYRAYVVLSPGVFLTYTP